jgi:hypothetical protein
VRGLGVARLFDLTGKWLDFFRRTFEDHELKFTLRNQGMKFALFSLFSFGLLGSLTWHYIPPPHRTVHALENHPLMSASSIGIHGPRWDAWVVREN